VNLLRIPPIGQLSLAETGVKSAAGFPKRDPHLFWQRRFAWAHFSLADSSSENIAAMGGVGARLPRRVRISIMHNRIIESGLDSKKIDRAP
jgi:hypothetical protein